MPSMETTCLCDGYTLGGGVAVKAQEHQGHWLCRIHDASPELYEACKAIERAIDTRNDLAPAFRLVKAAIRKAEEAQAVSMTEALSHEI